MAPKGKPKSKNATKLPKTIKRAALPEVLDAKSPDALNSEELESPEPLDPKDEDFITPEEIDSGRVQVLDPSLPETALEPTSSGTFSEPFKRYLFEIRKHPLLSPEEEMALVKKMQEEGDINAAKRLVQANLRLVVKIALEYRTLYSNLMDLIQEGNIGLMKAVSKFDPTKGARLGYYASWWIKSYILKYLLDNFRLVRIGTTQAQKKLFFHLMREKERLEAQGLLPAPKLIAEKLNVREQDVVEMQQRLTGAGGEFSIDAPLNRSDDDEGSTASHGDFLEDQTEAVDETLSREQLVQRLQGLLPEFEKTLNEKEKQILKERLLADEPKTLQEIATHYKLTRERARQIEAKVITKLKEFLGNAVLDSD